MTVNIWYDPERVEYCIRYEGRTYRRSDYRTCCELVESFVANIVAKTLDAR